jgi:voltage-gated potassium channel
VAYGDKTKPSSVEAWLEEHSPGYQYGYVLLLLFMTFIVMAAGPPDAWTRVVTVFLQGLTLLAALLASRVSRRLFRIAAIIALFSLLASLGSVVASGSKTPTSGFFILNILLVATVPFVIARSLWKRRVIDVRTVLGAVCIYVLLGMMFAFLYAAIDGLSSGPFFVQTSSPTVPDFLYFSYITQTTVGYGDFTAAGDLGRALAVLEALTGQLYLVTIIAVLVSRLSGSNQGRPVPTIEPAGEPTARAQDSL